MGCWNETCAISGLPIHEGQEVVRIEFSDLVYIVDFHDWFRIMRTVTGMEFGTYDGYGRLEENPDHNAGKATVFILRHFWDYAINRALDGDQWWLDKFQSDTERMRANFDNIDELKTNEDQLAWRVAAASGVDDGYHFYAKWGWEIHLNFRRVCEYMHVNRRTFYSAAYRGCQSEALDLIHYHKEIIKFIETDPIINDIVEDD